MAVGIFGGYLLNMGAGKDVAVLLDDGAEVKATRADNMEKLWRVAPRITYSAGRLRFALEGEVTSIQDGPIAVKTGLGEIKIPVARLRSVALKKVDLEKAKLRNGDIRAWFPDGSSIVFRLDEVGDGTLTGYTQNFGTATFKLSAFNRIEFNIHDPGFENQRALDDW